MKTVVKSHLEADTFCMSKSFNIPRKKEIDLVSFKFYQKLFVLFLTLSSILIFPESPKEMENVCESYNSRKICNVW